MKSRASVRPQKPVNRWLAVTLSIPTEFEEALSNFLMEQGAAGIEETVEAMPLQRLTAYVPQDGQEKGFLVTLRRYLKSLRKIYPEKFRYQMETVSIPEKDWGENWKEYFKPVQVTPRILVKPPWSRVRPKTGQIPIEINPGMAFGTGTHATTKLAIRALEERLQKKDLSVLDLGTGSGILAIVAAKLGAKGVWAVDLDPLSVEAATENTERNHISEGVRILKGTLGHVRKRVDVIVANIDFKVLHRMRWPLLRHLHRWGFLILSGILARDEDRIRRQYLETKSLQLVKVTHEDEWVCLVFRKKSEKPS